MTNHLYWSKGSYRCIRSAESGRIYLCHEDKMVAEWITPPPQVTRTQVIKWAKDKVLKRQAAAVAHIEGIYRKLDAQRAELRMWADFHKALTDEPSNMT